MHTLLRTEQLDASDLEITRVGFGAWATDGGWSFGWGPADDSHSLAAIRDALALGIDWIDTADVHDLADAAEVRVELSNLSPDDRSYVFTKCGLIWDDGTRTQEPRRSRWPTLIRRQCEESLRQLGVERVDLYQLDSRARKPASMVAVAWTLTSRGVAQAIVGASAANQIEGWVDAATLVIRRANLGEIATAIGRTGAGNSPQLPAALAA